MAQIGFIGLGKMGGRVAKRLLDAGHAVTGYNRTRSKVQWLLDAGMQWGASPRQVAEMSDVPLPSVALSNELLTAVRAMGMANEDFAVMGEGNIHDHPFEESYFLLSGEAEAILDGKTYHVKAGDYVWTGVGGTHGFFNKGTVPVRWIETQTPQPPNQHGFRFPADWAYLAQKLDAQDSM